MLIPLLRRQILGEILIFVIAAIPLVAVWVLDAGSAVKISVSVLAVLFLLRLPILILASRKIVLPDGTRLTLMLNGYFRGGKLVMVSVGESDARVIRYERNGLALQYNKLAEGRLAIEALQEEAFRLRWLQGRVPVPRFRKFSSRWNSACLTTIALPGSDLTAMIHEMEPKELVRLLARAMRSWHETPVDDCPFDHSPNADLDRALAAIEAGQVDEANFEPQWEKRSADDLLDELESMLPLPTYEPVLTHGDFTLPNVIIDRGKISGLVDVGRAGVSDRHKDLAICARSVRRNLGEQHVDLLFREYGITHVDPVRLKFFTMLDELF